MSDLPSLEDPQAYVVVGPDDQRGPYTMELLIGEVLAGRLSDATPVWWPGLSDWTTMGGHAAVAGEIERRRVAAAAPAPGWADPTPSGAPQPSYAQPAYEQPAPQPSYEPPAAYDEPATIVQNIDSGPVGAAPSYIDVDAAPGASAGANAFARPTPVAAHEQAAFDHLVARSSVRADQVGRVGAAEQMFLHAVTEAAAAAGFAVTASEDDEDRSELRFEGAQGAELVVTLGRFATGAPSDLSSSVVPLDVSARSSAQSAAAFAATGAHGEVVVVADEWTGQTSASVSLLLGLEDYIGADLGVDRAAVARDVGAAIAVVRARLG